MATVAEVLKTKKKGVLACLAPTATVREALQLMADREIGSVLVTEGERIQGIFTERDYARKIVLKGLHSIDVHLADVMTRRLYVVHPEETVQECMAIMTEAKVRHLPVVEDARLVGLVSIGDLVNKQLEEQRFIISQLENYIGGSMG